MLDAYGSQLTCATLPGDGYRSCHDGWLAHVLADLRDMGVPCEREVAGLFRGLLLPVAARVFDAMPWRQRRGMVPDARIRLKDAEGAVQLLLAELKFVHVGPTRYSAQILNRDGRCQAAHERCRTIQREYVDEAQQLDRDLLGVRPGALPGPVERRLVGYGEVRAMVVGSFGECSAFVHELAGKAALAGAHKHCRTLRCASPDDARSVLVAMLRRSWGMAALRANAQLVIGRLDLVGGLGAAMALRADPGRRRAMWRRRDRAGEHAGWGARGHH